MYRFCICEDDPIHLAQANGLLTALTREMGIHCSIDAFTNGKSLLDAAGTKIYDLVVLDMMIGDDYGIDLAWQLRKNYHAPVVVFTTAYEEFAVESFDVSPLHYLVKPVTREKMATALERFLKLQQPGASLRLTSGGQETLIVTIGDIAFLEALQTKVTIHMQDGTEHIVNETLYTLEAQLPESLFFRSHRSYLVNLSQVVSIRKYEFILHDKLTVPIAKRRYQQAKLALLQHFHTA